LRILFIGRLVIQKDPMTFMKALKILSDGTNDFEVHVLGDGNLRKKMEQFARKNGIMECMEFLGKIAPEKMQEEYQSAHLMVAPSLNEGMSIAALEALASGVYLIATRASGFPDIITEDINGNLIDYEDPEDLANMMKKYYYDKFQTSYEVAESFLGKFRADFSWDKVNKKYLIAIDKAF